MSILSLVKDPNKVRVENQLVRLLEAITHYFPDSEQVDLYELLLALTELIESEEAIQISGYISEFESFHSSDGEHAIVSLRCALQNKINIDKSQSISIEDELVNANSLIGTGETPQQNSVHSILASQLEKSLHAARRLKSSPHYSLLFTTILHETQIKEKMIETLAQPDCDNFKDRRIKLMNELLGLLESFRNNQISLDKFYQALKKHSRKTRVIPHTSTVGAAFGFFFGKLTATAKLSYDYLEVVRKLNETKEPFRLRMVV